MSSTLDHRTALAAIDTQVVPEGVSLPDSLPAQKSVVQRVQEFCQNFFKAFCTFLDRDCLLGLPDEAYACMQKGLPCRVGVAPASGGPIGVYHLPASSAFVSKVRQNPVAHEKTLIAPLQIQNKIVSLEAMDAEGLAQKEREGVLKESNEAVFTPIA